MYCDCTCTSCRYDVEVSRTGKERCIQKFFSTSKSYLAGFSPFVNNIGRRFSTLMNTQCYYGDLVCHGDISAGRVVGCERVMVLCAVRG